MYVLMQLADVPEALKYKKINSAYFHVYIQNYVGPSSSLYGEYTVNDISSQFDVDTATYNSVGMWRVEDQTVYKSTIPGYSQFTWKNYKNSLRNFYGIAVYPGATLKIQTPYGSNRPYFLVDYDDYDLGVTAIYLSPSSYVPQSVAQSFTWTLAAEDNFTISPLEATSVMMQWREGSSGSIHNIQSSSKTSVSVPAGTFPSSDIQWRVAVTANSGVTKYSNWVSIQVLFPRIESPTPSSGYVPKNKASEFSWSLVQPTSNTAKQKATQISAVFKWRAYDGAQIHEIPVSGSTTKVTVPANTFTTASFQWMVTATANGGATASSDWMTCSTLEVTSTARAVSPKNTVIQSGVDIVFTWEHIITTGTAPTGFDIQYSTDKSDWKDLLSGKTSETTATLQNNALPGGTVYWRVRTYNTDNAPGAWSDPAEIIVIAPPAAPTIQLEKISPRPIIRWSSLDQVAYEVEIVGVETYSQYGNANRYQSRAVLPDGLYTVRVRIQNKYAFWSAWGEASLTVFNSPSGSISLMATASETGEVQLSWSATGAFISFQILRNGSVIGDTTGRSYLDRLAIGACSYQIRGIVDSSGNYSLSGVQALTVTVPTVEIAPVSGGDWLALPYTTTDIREVSVSTSKSVTYQQFLGSPLPVGVVGEALSKSVQLSCAFPYRLQADAAKLEALIGQLVCVKDPRGRRYLGILGSMSHVSSRFYLSYNLTITPVACEEVDL